MSSLPLQAQLSRNCSWPPPCPAFPGHRLPLHRRLCHQLLLSVHLFNSGYDLWDHSRLTATLDGGIELAQSALQGCYHASSLLQQMPAQLDYIHCYCDGYGYDYDFKWLSWWHLRLCLCFLHCNSRCWFWTLLSGEAACLSGALHMKGFVCLLKAVGCLDFEFLHSSIALLGMTYIAHYQSLTFRLAIHLHRKKLRHSTGLRLADMVWDGS